MISCQSGRLRRARLLGQRGGERHRAHGLLQRAHRDAAHAVLHADELALLDGAQAAAHGAGRRAEHRGVGLPAAAADRAAAPVEQGELDARVVQHLHQRRLRLLQQPAGCGQPAVLVAVGVGDHDDLAPVAPRQVLPVDRVLQQLAHRAVGVGEVLAGLEQRRDVERHRAAGPVQLAPAPEQDDREHVVHAVAHADDEGADGAPPVLAPAEGDGLEDRERALGLVVEIIARRLVAPDRLADPLGALLRRALQPVAPR